MRPKKLLAGAVFGIAFFLGSAYLLKRVLLERAVRASVATVQQIEKSLPEPSEEEGEEFALFPFQALRGRMPTPPPPLGGEGEEEKSSPRAPQKKLPRRRAIAKKKRMGPVIGPPPKSTGANAETVLSWAMNQVVPTGRSVPPEKGLPAGIEVYGVGPLGLGLVDGDRLIRVDGTPVSRRGQVIGAAIAARSRNQKRIVATLARLTADGPQEFTVSLEQPYLTPEEEAEWIRRIEEKAQREAAGVSPPAHSK